MTGQTSEAAPVAGQSRAARSGGRDARRAARAAMVAADVVRPGLAGGQYRPLGDRDMARIHETALDVLERIGMADPIPATLKRALDAGCWLNAHGRLCFPRALVEDVVAAQARAFPIFARDPSHDRMVGEDRVHFCTAGEAVQVIDFKTGEHRPSTLLDLYDYYRLADRLDHIHHVGQPIVATDIEDIRAHNLSVAYAGMAGTTKSFGFSMANAEHVDEVVALADMVLGEEGAFLKRPFFQVGHCPVVSPLRFGTDTSAVQVRCAELGIISDMCVAPQAGATAPAALAGALVQACAETLAALVQVHLTRKGAKMFFGNWVFVSDLRTGAFTGGSGEEAVLMAGAAQMARFYDLPGSVAAGMTDSKALDYQAGFEKGLTVALAGLAGGNMVYEAAGMMSSLLATSFEAMVMDNELLGTVQRALRGIEVTDDTLSYEVMEDVVLRGPNHYLGHAQTLSLMQSEFLYPEVADRQTLSMWASTGRPTIMDHARGRVQDILGSHYPSLADPDRDAAIRARFPIRLAPGDMRADCGRW
ncbi:trimethylamine methyltransferase family protein [Frigidibacter sp. SD6-1]|uniref:trimethylamine methyltransferase family protein n=1 Tax=Frigidibacter sp. SD6-1 TaxID=3032581 RepID=UPI0024DFE348|nr:trimethylamine methyltransferase family protein [Frigidibacter sp. SD6-1]